MYVQPTSLKLTVRCDLHNGTPRCCGTSDLYILQQNSKRCSLPLDLIGSRFFRRYNSKLTQLALPSVVFEPRYRGSVRNLVYADQPGAAPRRQEARQPRDIKVGYHLTTQSRGYFVLFYVMCANFNEAPREDGASVWRKIWVKLSNGIFISLWARLRQSFYNLIT
jgi:hypothetical protein